MSGECVGGSERFEYLVVADCDHCGQEVKYVEEFEDPVALDRGVSIKWKGCPYCGQASRWWDVKEEFEIDRVMPTQERENAHLKRRRWDGDLDALDYETEDFEGGESVVLRYEDPDGREWTVRADCGGYESHNSWLLLWPEDEPRHEVTVNGRVRRKIRGDNYDYEQLGTAIEVRIVETDGGEPGNDYPGRFHPNLTVERTYVCEGCGRVFGSYSQALEHVENCAPYSTDRDQQEADQS